MRVWRFVASRFGRLRLVWKLLVPLVGMTLVVGLLGAFLIARHLSDQAEVDLEQDLFRRSVAAETTVRDARLDATDAVRFGANIQGVPDAVATDDATALRALVASVAATHTGLDLLVVAGADGIGLVELLRIDGEFDVGEGTAWDASDGGARLLEARSRADLRSGFVEARGTWILGVSGPVTTDEGVVGTVIAGTAASRVAAAAAERAGTPVSIYDARGRLIAASKGATHEPAPTGPERASVRRIEQVAGERSGVLFRSVDVGPGTDATIAVSVPTARAFEAAEGASLRLVILVVAAMAGIVALGLVLARVLLRQVRPLVETNRALGRGDLEARAPVYGGDELAELARGINLMAEQLEAAHAELEMRVAARTEELEHLYREGKETEHHRSQLFAEMVHEFRNQLFVIGGFGELMVDPAFTPETPDWRVEYGEAIVGAADDLRRRVDDILDLARSDAGQMHYEFEDLALPPFFADLSSTLVALARRGDIDMAIEIPTSLPRVRADGGRLRQIVMNLVSNAVKYTPPGGGITLRGRRRGHHVEISVSDTGIGIPPQAGERIFEPFYRATGDDESPILSSSGLGLAVSKRLVLGHGGDIDYRSERGAGTTFTFTLPVVTARPRSPSAPRKPSPRRHTARRN